MYSVGINVSKGKSTVCVLTTFGEAVRSPYEITHTESDMKELADLIMSFGGGNDIRVVMETTGSYSLQCSTICSTKEYLSARSIRSQ